MNMDTLLSCESDKSLDMHPTQTRARVVFKSRDRNEEKNLDFTPKYLAHLRITFFFNTLLSFLGTTRVH